MTNTDDAIVITLGSVAGKYHRPFCYPSQLHQLRLLKKWYGITISLSTLNRHLKKLELARFFDRVRRHRRGPDGKIIFNTTLYKLKKNFFKFAAFLKAQGDNLAASFRLSFRPKYRGTTSQGSGGNPSQAAIFLGQAATKGGPAGTSSGDPPPSPAENLTHLRELIKNIGS